MQVYLIRHGQSEENVADLQRSLEIEEFRTLLLQSAYSPLTALGVEQVQAVAARLATVGLTHLYASPYWRAQETAAIISQQTGVGAQTIEQLHEVNPLVPPVLRRNRTRSLRSLYIRGYLHQLWPHRLTSGETWWHARRRAADVWNTLSREWRPSSQVAIVAHRAFIWVILNYLDDHAGWQVVRRDFNNAGISEIKQV